MFQYKNVYCIFEAYLSNLGGVSFTWQATGGLHCFQKEGITTSTMNAISRSESSESIMSMFRAEIECSSKKEESLTVFLSIKIVECFYCWSFFSSEVSEPFVLLNIGFLQPQKALRTQNIKRNKSSFCQSSLFNWNFNRFQFFLFTLTFDICELKSSLRNHWDVILAFKLWRLTFGVIKANIFGGNFWAFITLKIGI